MDTSTGRTLPMVPGLPLLGSLLAFKQDKVEFVRRNTERYGEMFGFRLGLKNVAMLIGPELSEQFFKRTDVELSITESMQWLAPVVGQVMSLGGQEMYLQHRKIIGPILGGSHMAQHVEAMVKETRLLMQHMGDQGELDINRDFAQVITMNVAAHALIGQDFRQSFGEEFVRLFHHLADGLDQVLPPNLPLPRFIRRDRARAKVGRMLAEQIEHRRQMADPPDDFLQQLCEAKTDDGVLLDTGTVINLILLLIFAGFDTTSAHLAWGMVFLLENPDYTAKVQQEIDRVLGATPTPDAGAIRDLPHLGYVMTEVERMRPAVSVLMRVTTEDIELGGYTIPEGWMVMISPPVSHRLERVWSCPDEYDPERFNAERQEHRRHAFTLTGFGGGMHKCTGHKFAYNELIIILAMLFYEYAFELADPPVRPKEIEQIVRPANRIRYRRRTKAVPQPEEERLSSAILSLAPASDPT